MKNCRPGIPIPKFLLFIMRVTFFLFVIGVFQIYAVDSYAQKTQLTIHENEIELGELFSKIEEQTDFYFFYSNDQINKHLKVTLNVQDKTISEVLDIVLNNTDITYQVNNKAIILSSRNISTTQIEQQARRQIKGTVTDERGEPIIGANVIEKGTTNGVISDRDGNFLISVPSNATLQISYIGYLNQEVVIGNQNDIAVILIEDDLLLEEVVVVGYGIQKKANLTGAVSAVNFEDVAITSRSLTNVSTMLAGMSSGIRVQQVNGLPSNNNDANMTIRGTGTLNAGSAPLVIVDGQVASINSVSPNDVASVSILKDAASAAIYGSRASNGVILITTKTGKNTQGKISFNYDNFIGTKGIAHQEDLVSSTADYMILTNRAFANAGRALRFPADEPEEYRERSKTDPIRYPNTDWMKAVTKDNIIQNHHFSARGGNDRISFYSSVDYMYDDGLILKTDFKRINFRTNLDYKVNDWLKMGTNFTTISTESGPVTLTTVFQWMRATNPGVLPVHPDGRVGAGSFRDGTGGGNQPMGNILERRGENKGTRMQNKIYAVFTPLKGLSITGSYFKDFNVSESWSGNQPMDRWNFTTNTVRVDRTTGAVLSLTTSDSKNQREVVDVFADYNTSIGSHNIQALVGFNQEYYFSKSQSATRRGLLSYDTPVLDAASGDISALTGNTSDFAMRSVFGRLAYNYKGKYLLESNLRYDGSSRFAPDERWGLFPSFSAGWMISEEEFWAPLSATLNAFKLRASWGQLGNNSIGNYDWQSFYVPANYANDNTVVAGMRYNAFGNPIVTWEATNVLNVGADIRLFNTLSLDLNYYNKVTNNILANLPIPLINGGITAPRVNSAEVHNSGFETEARYFNTFGKLSVNLGINFGYNKNRIVSYKGDLIEPRGEGFEAWTEGHPIGIYWVREIDRIIQTQAEVDALVADGYTFHPTIPGPGDFLYKDNNGDKAINNGDRVLKGNPIPLYTYGGNIGLGYGGFDFSIFFDGVAKWDRFINGAVWRANRTDGYQWPVAYMNMWTEENPSTTIPKMYIGDNRNAEFSDFYIYKADYLKIRSIQLGYSLPADLLKKVRIEKLRIFTNFENYFTFTSWPSADPEVVPTGTEHNTYPITKTFSVGLNVSF